jgi:hypothetical protein
VEEEGYLVVEKEEGEGMWWRWMREEEGGGGRG